MTELFRPHPLYPLHKSSRVCVCGKTGSGKSTFVKALMAEIRAHNGCVLGFDQHDEFGEDCELMDEMEPGPLRDRCTADELVLHPEWLNDPDLALAVLPNPDDKAADLRVVSDLLVTAQKRTKGKRLVVMFISEVGAIKAEAEKTLNAIATEYRKFGIAEVMDSQRMTGIPYTSRVQASDLVSFLQDDEDDIEALRFKFKERADQISSLKRGEYVHWRDTALTPAAVRPIRKAS